MDCYPSKDYLHANLIYMSNGNRKKTKGPSGYKDAKTGKTYTKVTDNTKASSAADTYAKAHPKKAFYA